MIKIEEVDVWGWESAIRGMRNPMNSWDKSDSFFGISYEGQLNIGVNDLRLMENLVRAGNDHAKFMRMINVTMDITAPLYWYKEFDTYKVGTVANSCSTMHKIHAKEFTLDDFSHEHLIDNHCLQAGMDSVAIVSSNSFLQMTCDVLNIFRNKYLETKDKKYWWQMIQLLPSSYNQKRTVQLNYAVLRNMYHSRRNHKLDEWVEFCKWVETLPYAELITGKEN
jgi:hypothetical protein